jgi:hypothetical protein
MGDGRLLLAEVEPPAPAGEARRGEARRERDPTGRGDEAWGPAGGEPNPAVPAQLPRATRTRNETAAQHSRGARDYLQVRYAVVNCAWWWW